MSVNKIIIIGVLSFLCLIADASAIDLGVGTMSGKLSVDNSGAARYSIPIKVAPAAGGLEPDLSLEYNSRNENGYLGVGWQLSGLSSIYHCPSTIAQDGYSSGVDIVLSPYCLDGKRLDGNLLEVDDYSRIQRRINEAIPYPFNQYYID